jgi:hypothetical protein
LTPAYQNDQKTPKKYEFEVNKKNLNFFKSVFETQKQID